MVQRMGDQADFEQFDLVQAPSMCIAVIAAGAVPEAEAVHIALFQRSSDAAIRIVDSGNYPQTALILGNGFDPADPLIRAMLPV